MLYSKCSIVVNWIVSVSGEVLLIREASSVLTGWELQALNPVWECPNGIDYAKSPVVCDIALRIYRIMFPD